MSVSWLSGSHSSECPPNTGCEVNAVVTLTKQPDTRLGKDYAATTIEHQVHTTGCGTDQKTDQPIYSTTPIELLCICEIHAVCSACEPL